jgi:hypothetical protein
MLVFYSPESLERLANAKTFFIFMDDTLHQTKLLYLSPLCLCQVVETALMVDVATKYSCNCTKNCIFKVWTLKCRLLAWQFKQ